MHDNERQIPIWFFIGMMLSVYGLIITAAGAYEWINPPPPDRMVKLWHYHADLWWGILLVIFGLVYTVKFRPSKVNTLTGERPATRK